MAVWLRALPALATPAAALLARNNSVSRCDPRPSRDKSLSLKTLSCVSSSSASSDLCRREFVGIGSMNGNKASEDRFAFEELCVGDENVSLLSVFDGHGGDHVASYLEDELPSLIRRKLPAITAFALSPAHLQYVLRSTYAELDETLNTRRLQALQHGFDVLQRVGSTAITVAVTGEHLVVANAGDCRAILGTSAGDTHELSTVHNVDNPEERARLRSEHPEDPFAVKCAKAFFDPVTDRLYKEGRPGFVPREMNCYIRGMLQTSRSFGDFALKSPSEAETPRSYITAEPEIRVFPRSKDHDLLVVGSDGLFDDVSPEEILQIAREAASPQAAAERLIHTVHMRALQKFGLSQLQYDTLPKHKRRKVHDDVTVLVYFLR